MSVRRDLHAQNRASWNHATRAHNAHKVDQAAFLAAGGTTLFPEERALLGDVAGQRLVHLQCNAGQDTLSIAALGADVLGVDISDDAIGFARQLSADAGIPAAFARADVYDWLDAAAPGSVDIVFASYGWMGWLSDLDTWARGVARLLAPGGRLVVVEFHPLALALSADGRLIGPVRTADPIRFEEGIGDYVGDAGGALSPSGHVPTDRFDNPEPTWEFGHDPGDFVSSVCAAGLRLEAFHQWPFANGFDPWNTGHVDGERRFWPPAPIRDIPVMFGAVARRGG